jgi:hypothetical protein
MAQKFLVFPIAAKSDKLLPSNFQPNPRANENPPRRLQRLSQTDRK